jgi:IS5 family transposase
MPVKFLAKLLNRARERLVRFAADLGVELRQSYARVGKLALIKHQRYAHAHQFKRATRSLRKLKTYLGRVIRDIGRRIDGVGWGEMPFEPLLEELERRAETRVIRADDPWVKKPGGKPPAKMVSGAIKAVRRDPSERGLWVELDVS